jgi:uncharacterized membrane-anchored protein
MAEPTAPQEQQRTAEQLAENKKKYQATKRQPKTAVPKNTEPTASQPTEQEQPQTVEPQKVKSIMSNLLDKFTKW